MTVVSLAEARRIAEEEVEKALSMSGVNHPPTQQRMDLAHIILDMCNRVDALQAYIDSLPTITVSNEPEPELVAVSDALPEVAVKVHRRRSKKSMTTRFCPCEQAEIIVRPSGAILCGKCGLPFKPAAAPVPERP